MDFVPHSQKFILPMAHFETTALKCFEMNMGRFLQKARQKNTPPPVFFPVIFRYFLHLGLRAQWREQSCIIQIGNRSEIPLCLDVPGRTRLKISVRAPAPVLHVRVMKSPGVVIHLSPARPFFLVALLLQRWLDAGEISICFDDEVAAQLSSAPAFVWSHMRRQPQMIRSD